MEIVNAQVRLCGSDDVCELAVIFLLDLLESEDGRGLLVDDTAETSLALHNHIRNTHLTAESREENDEFNGVDIVGDDDKRRLLRLNEGNDVVETVLSEERLFGRVRLVLRLALSGLSGCRGKTLLLLLLSLRAIPANR